MIFLFLHKNMGCGHSLLAEALLMSTHKILFLKEIRKYVDTSYLEIYKPWHFYYNVEKGISIVYI